jgi:3-oxoacyl-[acyl-carrier protein] reductase
VVETLAADVGDPDQAAVLIHRAESKFGRVDVVVNNAGIAPLTPIVEMSDEQYRACIQVNADAVFYTTRAAWPIMTRQQSGVIVNISSVAALDPFPGFAVYGACKAWVNLFTKAAASEGERVGIRCYAVGPGAVETRMLRGPFPNFPAHLTLAPEEVAEVVFNATKPNFAHRSGTTIYVRKREDGGVSVGPEA